jgi:hypothetical protein
MHAYLFAPWNIHGCFFCTLATKVVVCLLTQLSTTWCGSWAKSRIEQSVFASRQSPCQPLRKCGYHVLKKSRMQGERTKVRVLYHCFAVCLWCKLRVIITAFAPHMAQVKDICVSMYINKWSLAYSENTPIKGPQNRHQRRADAYWRGGAEYLSSGYVRVCWVACQLQCMSGVPGV